MFGPQELLQFNTNMDKITTITRRVAILVLGTAIVALGICMVQQSLFRNEAVEELENGTMDNKVRWDTTPRLSPTSSRLHAKPVETRTQNGEDDVMMTTTTTTSSLRWNDSKNIAPSDQGDNETTTEQLINFAVIGFEKCGTTFLLKDIFHQSEQVFMAGGESGTEVNRLDQNHLSELQDLFRPHANQYTPDGYPIKTGFKNPTLPLTESYLKNMAENFPRTKLVVTVRHPVLWFQSWYNFKVRRANIDYPMPSPHSLMGLCHESCRFKGLEGGQCIRVKSPGCSGHALFHQFLSRLGFTAMNTKEELDLLDHHQMAIFNFSQTQLFLTEIGQLDGKNATVSETLVRSLEAFIGVESHALPDIETYEDPNWTKDKPDTSIDICDETYSDIRAVLLDIGRKAGTWIEHYLLASSKVIVADRNDLVHRIRQWEVDPCL